MAFNKSNIILINFFYQTQNLVNLKSGVVKSHDFFMLEGGESVGVVCNIRTYTFWTRPSNSQRMYVFLNDIKKRSKHEMAKKIKLNELHHHWGNNSNNNLQIQLSMRGGGGTFFSSGIVLGSLLSFVALPCKVLTCKLVQLSYCKF